MTRLVYVCEGGDCSEKNSGDVHDKLREKCEAWDPEEEKVRVRRYPCFGACECGINIAVYPDKVFYSHVTEADIPEILGHITEAGEPPKRLTGAVEPDIEEFVWEMLDSPY